MTTAGTPAHSVLTRCARPEHDRNSSFSSKSSNTTRSPVLTSSNDPVMADGTQSDEDGPRRLKDNALFPTGPVIWKGWA